MCTVCGCASGNALIGNMKRPDASARSGTTQAWRAVAPRPANTAVAPGHAHAAADELPATIAEAAAPPAVAADVAGAHHHHLHYGDGPAHAHAPGLTQGQMIRIERDILGKNDTLARANRERLAQRGIFTLNLVSSPGSGKTTLLVETIRRLADSIAVSVIEGDQQTEFDADRIRATGAPALQINTGKGCHLDADMIGRALTRLDPPAGSLLLIENVGNLVCPAAFDLGEAHKVVILSITEGEDKPLKYPDMFAAADLMLLSKIDLAPHLDFDIERAIGYARQVRPELPVIACSAKTGEGFDAWLAWIRSGVAAARKTAADVVARR